MAFLQVRDLYKNFGETQVLKGVSFEMEKGEVVSVIGSSGNGKTTLLRCLNFLERADSGTITVDGEVIFPLPAEAQKQEKAREKRLTFGMVFQNFNLFPQYNALKNITLAMDVQSENALKAQGVKCYGFVYSYCISGCYCNKITCNRNIFDSASNVICNSFISCIIILTIHFL